MKQRKIAGTIADATLPKTPLEIGGATYYLCFTLGALSRAETAINAELAAAGSDERVNLLEALPAGNLAGTRNMFAAGVRAFHPELGFDEARELLNFEDIYTVALAVREAWKQSRAQPKDEENPISAAAAVA